MFVLPKLEWERVTQVVMVVEEVVEVETRVSAAAPLQRRLEKLHQHYDEYLTTRTWHRLEMNPPACIIRSWR